MKIVTKNIKLEKGVRHYLIYLNDYNGNPLECLEAEGDEDRIKKENKLSKKHNISTKDIDYVSLEKFRSQTYLENKGDDVRLFFLPTDGEEKITCVNPVYIDEQKDFDRLNDLIEDLTNKFQIGDEQITGE